MIFVGDTSVGKSCIMQRFTSNNFDQDITPTVGASFVSKELIVENQHVVLNIWDTAGQEAYRYLVPMYYRGTDIAIIVFDLSKKETFNSVRQWIEDVRKNCSDNVMIYVIGNKSDLEEIRDVSRKEIVDLENEFNVVCFETSALTGDGVEKMFSYSLTYFIQMYPTDFKNQRESLQIDEKQKKCC